MLSPNDFDHRKAYTESERQQMRYRPSVSMSICQRLMMVEMTASVNSHTPNRQHCLKLGTEVTTQWLALNCLTMDKKRNQVIVPATSKTCSCTCLLMHRSGGCGGLKANLLSLKILFNMVNLQS